MTRIVSRTGLKTVGDAEGAIADVARQVGAAFKGYAPPAYSVTALPSAAKKGVLIFVPDAADGAVLCVSDGTQWLEFKPTGPVS